MNGETHDWRSPDGIMEARTVGGVRKDATQGWKPEEPWKGQPFTNFDWGYFIPNTSYTKVGRSLVCFLEALYDWPEEEDSRWEKSPNDLLTSDEMMPP